MKKTGLFLLVLGFAVFAFVSCTTAPSVFQVVVPVSVVEYFSGPALSEANVTITLNGNVIGNGVTDARGNANVNVVWNQAFGDEVVVEVRITKVDYAPSVMKGLILYANQARESALPIVEMAANRANMDPAWTDVPELEITFLDEDGVTPLDLTNVEGLVFNLSVNSEEYWDVMYVGIGDTPSAFGRNGFSSDQKEDAFELSFAGHNGIVPIHVVAYDYNRSRVDYVFFATVINPSGPVTEVGTPTGLWLYSMTTDKNTEYYVDPRNESMVMSKEGKKIGEFQKRILNNRGAPDGCNIIVQVAWDAPTTGDAPIGYNIYRSEVSATEGFRLVAFRSAEYGYGYDRGVGLEPGQSSWYKVRTVYADGTESPDSNVVELIPLDIFKVKLLSPADGSSDVSQLPNFTWKPVKQGSDDTAEVGCGVIPEEDIIYDYTLWIYDCSHNEQQHILPIVLSEFDSYYETWGPKVVTVPFLESAYYDEVDDETYAVLWAYITEAGETILYPYEGLEAYKSYEWGLDYAWAYYVSTPDANGGRFIAQSTTIDLGYGLDWNAIYVNDADYYNRFTTGKNLGTFVNSERGE
ncbi:MAG TPA: hypothetical protein PLO55_11760 [Thermotogota bacterium]|nr:hypothetical protein [Thermotogota bacterium]